MSIGRTWGRICFSLGVLAQSAFGFGGLLSPLHAQVTETRSQDTVFVNVRVMSDAGPIVGAEVWVSAGGAAASERIRTSTNETGEARLALPGSFLSAVGSGSLLITARHPGFLEQSVTAPIPTGAEGRVELRLARDEAASRAADPVEVAGITVGLTRTAGRVQDQPLRVEVLDREEIEEKLLMSPGNIVMLLNETGGLRVQTTSPALGAANIRVQGMRGRYTLLLADGLPLYGGQAGAIGLLQIPPVDLGQVEVVKGVASALYGGGALGGVVNLISRGPEDEPALELLTNVTSQNGQDLTAYGSLPLSDNWGLTVLGGAHRQTATDLDGSGWADLAGFRRMTFRPRLFWNAESGGRARLTLGFMNEDRNGGTLPGRTAPDGLPFQENLETERFDAGVSVLYPLGPSRLFQLRGSLVNQRHRHTFGEVRDRDHHQTAFLEVALSGGGARQSWVIGGALQEDRFRSDAFSVFDHVFTVPAGFAQTELRVADDVTLSASARWDQHSHYGGLVSPRFSALYRPGAWTFRGSLGGGFFAPTPFVEEIEAAGLSRLEPIAFDRAGTSDGLRAERARTASFDAGRDIGPLETNLTLFASRVQDAVQIVSAPQLRLMNVPGETRTSGFETLVRTHWDDISVTGSYVFVHATEPDPMGSGARRAVPLTPKHTVGMVAMWEDHDRGILGVEGYYTGRQSLDDNPYRTTARPQVHLGVLGELRMGGWSVFVNAENLLNVRQTRHDPLLRPSRAPDGRWTVDAWAPLDGFALNGGVRIRLGEAHDHH